MTEKVRVAARIRPLPTAGSVLAVAPLDERRVCVSNRRVYHVDRVYGRHDSTELIFFESVVALVDRFLAGYNATVLAYGQTGTGKTYTMDGLTPLVVRYIVENMSNSTSKLSFQCIEVYGETLRDLLTDDPVGSTKHLQLHESDGSGSGGGGGGVVVVGAARVKARSIAEVQDIINHGARMRTTGATNMSEHSSRSHSIFTIFNHERQSKLNLVDLAGSERNKKTQNVGQRFRESIAINGGLLALGNVIRALSRNHFQSPESPRHVPYRSSKLTRLLRDSLGGNSTTLLIACVASDASNSDETTRTLQYAAFAMHILNEPLPQFDDQAAAAEVVRNADAGHDQESLARKNADDISSEAAAEVGRLRQRVAGLEEQVQRCRDELKNDEAVFAQQIKDMRLLLEENESLRRRVAFLEGRPTATPRSTPDMRQANWQQQQKHQEQQQQQQQWNSVPIPPNVNYVQDTLQLYGIIPRQNDQSFFSHPSSQPRPAVWGEERAVQNHERHPPSDSLKRPIIAARWGGAAAAVNAAGECTHVNKIEGGWGDGGQQLTAREEQLGLLAKEALYYQNSNSELRRRLRTVLAMYEAQQHEAAMLRLEVKQIHDLLDGPPHS
ncbi:putative kinesin [Trypanosoma cruzi]|uniref:Kinesin-like protein n=1 Tax=Trypanosoma cruzi TaxID=5693 RepID=A0A7J6XRP8_TRYCR|nr:hypothetical protein ECC02_010275 [Trypanosoma cruzi]KAF8302643.1 putative kinesin [Trypanosoma cruzi]